MNWTHSRRFERIADARRSRSVWSACVFSAAFPSQAASRRLGRFMEKAEFSHRASTRRAGDSLPSLRSG